MAEVFEIEFQNQTKAMTYMYEIIDTNYYRKIFSCNKIAIIQREKHRVYKKFIVLMHNNFRLSRFKTDISYLFYPRMHLYILKNLYT